MNCPREINVLLMGLTIGMSCAVAPAAEKRHFEAHVHGVAEINIAVEGSKADVEFRAPAENIMGFEHEAKSESDKKKRDASLRMLQTKMSQMVLFDPKLSCNFPNEDGGCRREGKQNGTGAQGSKESRRASGSARHFVRRLRQAACRQPRDVRCHQGLSGDSRDQSSGA